MRRKKLFIVFDGPEGGGKSTQIRLLEKYLRAKYSVLVTKEPGGGDEVNKDIRTLVLNPSHKGAFSARAELLLFCADRAQHVACMLNPMISEGAYDVILCDRYEGVMYAYQCYARQACGIDDFRMLNTYATQGLKPDFTFILDVPYETGALRNKKTDKKDRFELEEKAFHDKGREGFKEYCKNELPREKWMIIDAQGSKEEVFEKIKEKIDALLSKQKAAP